MLRQPQPSRVGLWLLRLRAGDAWRDEVVDDLLELYRLRAASRGRWYAEWRWLRDALSVRRPRWPAPPAPRRDHMIRILLQELRFVMRGLAAQRRFTAIALLVIALGIGATTAVFSVFNAVILRPLPYAAPDRLVAVTGLYHSAARTTTSPFVPLTEVAKWRPLARSFESMGAFAYTQLPVRIGDRSFSPITALMDPEFLPTLGTPLARGTLFAPDARPGTDPSAILSHALWVEAFQSDPSAIGRTITLDGTPFVVRGVLAAAFQFPRADASYSTKPVDLLVPAAAYPGFPAAFRQWFGIARLKPDVAIEQAQAELQSVALAVATAPAAGSGSWTVRLTPLAEETTRRSRQALVVILGLSIVLLLIASTNLMNLLFARGVSRLHELGIRRALGSTTWQLLRLLLIESLVLAVAGGLAGIWLAALAIRAIVAMLPPNLPVTQAIDIDATVLAFTSVLCLATAIAAGLLPAWQVSARTNDAVRSPGRRASMGRPLSRVQQGLCVSQIALGMALLAGAGLLAHSLWKLNRVPPGFDSQQVLGFNVSVPNDVRGDARARFYQDALTEVRTIPGVEAAGLISFLPPETRAGVFMGLAVEGDPPPEPAAPPRTINTLIASPDYFKTMRMQIVSGRDLLETDLAGRTPVVVVNETFQRRYLPEGQPIGRKIGTGFDGLKPVREIVGVVEDTHDRGLSAAPIPTVYIPFAQFSLPYGAVALRTAAAPASVVPVIRDRLRRLNASVPLTDFQTLDDRLRDSLREPRFYTLLAATCAGMAVLFVTFGLYGLVSYSVSRRTTELGIRMAVGAQRGEIVRLVLAQGLRMAAAGVVLGLGLAFALTRALESLLFGVQPIDLPTFAAAAGLVIIVTLAASYAPARRACRVNPITVLRQD
jgi:putative ABC transport system permease protein